MSWFQDCQTFDDLKINNPNDYRMKLVKILREIERFP